MSLSGSIAVVTVHTTATIGGGARINCADGDVACVTNSGSADGSQSVLVSAVNSFRTLGIAASIAIGGSAGVGASVAVRVVELHTDASIAGGAVVNARNNIEVRADARTAVVSVNAAAGGGTVGVAGTVGVTVIKEYTNAFTGIGVTLRADNNIGVFANDASQLILITASIAAGYVGVGVGVGVAVIDKTTRAYIGQSSTVIVKALGGGLSGVSNGTIGANGLPTTIFRGLVVQAQSTEKLFGLVAGVGAGFVGVTANIGVNIFTVTTRAYLDLGTRVNQGAGTIAAGVDDAQAVAVIATDVFDSLTFAGGVAGGFVGASGGVDIGVASITVNAYLATGTDVWAKGDVRVNALAIKHVQSYAVSIGGGFVGVAGAVSVWSIGTAPTASYSSDAHGPHRGAWSSTTPYASGDVVTYNSKTWIAKKNSTNVTPGSNATIWQEDVPKTATDGEGTDGQHQADQVASGEGSDAPAPAWNSATAYSKGDYVTFDGTRYQATVDVSAGAADPANSTSWYAVKDGWKSALDGAPADGTAAFLLGAAYATGDYVTFGGHRYRAKVAIASADATPIVDLDRWANADDDYRFRVFGGAAASDSSVAGSYSESSPTADQFSQPAPPSGVSAGIYGTVHSMLADVEVVARERVDVFVLAGAVAGGAGAIGAGIAILNIAGRVDAGIFGTAVVSAGGAVRVTADLDENVTIIAVTGTVGAVAVAGQILVLTDTSSTTAHIDDSADVLKAAAGIFVTAHSDKTAAGYAVGITIALGGVGAAISVIEVSGDTTALIGDVAIGAGGAIGGITVTATDAFDPTAWAIGVVGGVGIGLSGIVAVITYSGLTRAASFAHGAVTIGGGVSVQAFGQRQQMTGQTLNITTGAAALGFTVSIATMDRDTEAELGGSITASGSVAVNAEATNVVTASTPSVAIGGIAVSAMIPIATVSGHTTATLSGIIGGSASAQVRAAAENRATADVLVVSISGLGLNVAVAVAEVTADADITATVADGASISSSGAVSVTALVLGSSGRIEAIAKGENVAAALFGSGAVFVAMATQAAAVAARLDGDVTSSTSVSVTATGGSRAKADLVVVAAGGLAGIAVSVAVAEISSGADVTASSSDANDDQQITSSGKVSFNATSTNVATVTTGMGAGGALFGVSVSVPSALVGGATTASVQGDVTAGAAGVEVGATSHNSATTDVLIVSIGGLGAAAVNVADARITSAASTRALVLAGASVSAPGGAVSVHATATNVAAASTTSVSASATLSVSAQKSLVTIAGSTTASFDGDIPSTTIRTAALSVTAIASNDAFSDTKVVTIGLLGGATVIVSEAIVSSNTDAVIDADANIALSGALSIDAHLATGARGGYQNVAESKIRGAGGGLGGGFNLMSAKATVSGSTSAKLNGAVTAASSFTINADARADALATSDFASFGGVAMSGSETIALVSGHTIAGGDSGTAGGTGAFTVTADSTYNATAESDGPTIGLLTVDVKLPSAAVSGSTKANYLGQVTSGTSATATANSHNTALADASDIISIGLIAVSVAYALAVVSSSTEAALGGASVSGTVLVSATSDDDATALAGGVSGGAIGVQLLQPDARSQGSTRAFVGNGKTVSGTSLTIQAIATPDAHTEANMVGFAAVADVLVTNPVSTIGGTTEAFIGDDETVTLGSGAVTLTATRTANASVEGTSIAISPISISAVDLQATTGGTIAAHIDDRADVTGGSVSLTAGGTSSPVASSTSVGVSVIGLAGVSLSTTDSTTVASWIGPVDGASAADAADPTNVTTSTASGISVKTDYTAHVLADAIAAGFGLLFAGALVHGTATATPTVLAYLGHRAELHADGGGSILIEAAAVVTAIADGTGFSAGAIAAGQITTKADLRPIVKAYTVGGGALSGTGVTVRARVNTDTSGAAIKPTYTYNTIAGNAQPTTVAPAFARASLGGASLVASASGATATAINSPTVLAAVGTGTSVSATGALNVIARSLGDSEVDGYALAASIGVGIGLVSGTATSGGSVDAGFHGVSGAIGSANILAIVSAHAESAGRGFSGALGVAINAGSQQATVSVTVRALVGGTLVATGSVLVRADVRTSASAEYRALQLAALAAVGTADVDATDESSIRSAVTGSGLIRSTSGNVTVSAWHNFDGSDFIDTNRVEASSKMASAGLLAIGTASLDAVAKATTKAEVEAGATLAAPSGGVTLESLSGDYALAHFERTQGGFASIAPSANPTAEASGTTEANLLGHVRVVSGGTSSGGSSLTVLAKAEDLARAGMDNAAGGLLEISSSNSTAKGTPHVKTTLGGAASVILTTGAITAKAESLNDADAATSSASGGLLRISTFSASATMTPTVSLVVTGGASITSASGTITIDATSNRPPPPSSDGTFNAGTVSGNTISFALQHNAYTGQLVVYDTQNAGAPVATGLNGRSINIIVTGANSLQLGLEFTFDDPSTTDVIEGATIDPDTDIIDFGFQSHHFETGDLVVYQPVGGAIGGLAAGVYKVYKIDATHLKLQSTSVDVTNPPQAVATPGQIDTATDRITGSLSNGQYVTYHAAPAANFFSSSNVSGNTITVAADTVPSSGTPMQYFTNGAAIGGLSNGATYYVIRVNGSQLRLATTYCNARGIALGANAVCNSTFAGGILGDDGAAGSASVVAISLNAGASATTVRHQLNATTTRTLGPLQDLHGYWVVGANGSSFQLSTGFNGSAMNLTDGGAYPHIFRVEGLDLTGNGSGIQRLVLQISPTSGTQRLNGIGGPSGAANSNDGIVSATAAGGGGGAINVSTASSTAATTVTVSVTVEGSAAIRGTDVTITTHGTAQATGVAGNAGGGAISIGDSDAQATTTIDNDIAIVSGAVITATDDLTIAAYSNLQPKVLASTQQGGLVGGSFGSTDARGAYSTRTTTNGTLTAGDRLAVESHTAFSGFADSVADVGGLGASAETEANVLIGVGGDDADTLTEVGGALTGRHVRIGSFVDAAKAYAHTYTYAIALGADSDASSQINIEGYTRTTLLANAAIVGHVDTAILSEWLGVDFNADAFAECDCGGGDTDSYAKIFPTLEAKVVGRHLSVITTSDLTVQVNDRIDRMRRHASTSGGLFDGGNDGDAEGSNSALRREIFWETRVIMLGEPNPILQIDATGAITAIVNLRVCDDAGHCYQDDPFTDTHTQGTLSGTTITVDDIEYDHGAQARFLANDLSIIGGPEGSIWGGVGRFEFQQTWDFVRILNASSLNLVTNIIDVVNAQNPPRIDIRVDTIWDNGAAANASLSEDDPNTTFDFDIEYTFPPTYVQIHNTCAFTCPVRQPFIRLDDYIENPLGETEIFNASGDILSGSGHELIRTNVIDIDAPHGDIGHQSPTHQNPDPVRNPIEVELVHYIHPDPDFCAGSAPCDKAPVVTLDAGWDVVVDLTYFRRTDTALGTAATIVMDRIRAGDDVDVVLNDSKNGDDPSELVLVIVDMYEPSSSSTYYGFAFPSTYTPAINDGDSIERGGCTGAYPGDCGTGSGRYETHFRPDVSDADLAHILRALGTDVDGEIDSTYDFTEVRAGDDIDICHVTTGGQEPKTCFTTTIDSAAHNVTSDPASDTRIDIVIGTDVAWTGGAGHTGPVDDPGMTVNVAQIFIRTDGDITATELVGDMLVGHIHSTNGDVELHSPMRILDADGRSTIDVTGVDITMYAGEAGGVGGIGTPTDWLEIDTAVLDPTWDSVSDGVLKAYDLDSDDAQTTGIHLDELTGDMPLWEIFTAGSTSTATGNVTLRTVGGSILNAKTDADEDNIRGDSVDLDANGGSIGLQSKDVMVDSGRAPPFGCTYLNCGNDPLTGASDPALAAAGDDVGLEATGGIYYTETDSHLRLVLAHSLMGNIRLTVRETAQLDEDLYLVRSGTAQFAESNTRGPNGDVDAPRAIPNGTIFAETGSVELRVGDDVTLHQNTQILANLSIDIRGDFGNADTGAVGTEYGTSMILRGRLIADCVVTPGGPGDEPMGVCAPSAANPDAGRQTNIWGGSDVDIIQLGDPSGLDLSQPGAKTTWGSAGYVFLGSKTLVHGNATLTSNTADGEDEITVWHLQSMNVVTSPTGLQSGAGAGHTLTLDGQGETDHYAVYTSGSHGSVRNYVINVLDSGPANDGVDELDVYGYDNTAAGYNGPSGATDDIWLMRALTCIDNQSPFALNAGAPATCATPTEQADHPAFIALLAGNGNADGGIGLYRDRVQGNEPSSLVQRITYDRALNGRITVFGLAGNDAFYVDDTQATMTLDGGAGNDTFQIGQIFGTQRDGQPAPDGGALLSADTFPSLVPTTRGWLSPGTHAPLLAAGGTGNDRFVVYANQAEIQLSGDDGNDLFIVRAFAIAAVCDTNADNIAGCGLSDVDYRPAGGVFPQDAADGTVDGRCLLTGGYIRYDNNGDGVCNNADAHITYNHAAGSNVDLDHTMWRDDVIPLNAGVAVPVIGLGFSTSRPLDIRAGGGEDEVQYNVNAPVNVDGGTGFDKLVVLGTEFADDFAITDKAIYGAGLNVKYTTIEVLEIDGLEGDDQFFVLSTAYGVAYRVIGGLGSDQISVAGDVTTDIVTRELEGISGAVDHIVLSDDPRYDGIVVDGVPYNFATPGSGVVVIKESGSSTSVREGTTGGPITERDYYTVELSHAPTGSVYVTVSAALSPDEEARDTFHNPTGYGLTDGPADTIWVCVDTFPYGDQCITASDFQRHYLRNGVIVDEAGRAVVLTFDAANWNTPQRVYVRAYDDLRSEGDRTVVVQHSVIAADPIADAEFDGATVRQVNVRVYDDDTPGVYVSHVEPSASCTAVHATCVLDDRGVVIEGSTTTQRTDQVLVQLAKDPGGLTITVRISMDAASQRILQILDPGLGASRWTKVTDPALGTWYLLTFDSTNWDDPVLLTLQARSNPEPGDPTTAVISWGQEFATSAYRFPNLRSGVQRSDVLVYDDEAAQVVTVPTGTDTVVVQCGDTACTTPGLTDGYDIRLTTEPNGDVRVVITPDGLVDVVSVNGVAISPAQYVAIGGDIPSRVFLGNLTFSGSTVTRANGSDTGSFLSDGIAAGMRVRFAACTDPAIGYYTVLAVAADGKSFTLTVPLIGCGGSASGTSINVLTRRGIWDGAASAATATGDDLLSHYRLTRAGGGWLSDGFLEGQWVQICDDFGHCVRAKIQNIRGTNLTHDQQLEFRPVSYDDLAALVGTHFTVVRIAAQATFTASDWYLDQRVELQADLGYYQPIVRQGVKTFPASQHLLSRLRGPLAVEGGVSGADRSLELGLKLPGEQDGPLFGIAAQAPESKQIDVLNIYGDGSVAHNWGAMTSTTIRGLGMAGDLDFGASYGGAQDETFGEPQVFPGGISFGSVSFVDGAYATDGGRSTIEVVNLFLGSGNDRFDVQGTLQPDVPVKLIGTVVLAASAGQFGSTHRLSRTAPFDWKAQGFLVGQPVTISGMSGLFRVVGFGDDDPMDTTDDTVMYLQLLSGSASVGTALRTVIAQDVPVTITVPVTIVGGAAGGTVTRATGNWITDGFVVGQLVRIANISGQWRLVGVTATTLTLDRGDALPSIGAPVTQTVFVPGPHGGLTTVHGGGNSPIRTVFEMDRTAPTAAQSAAFPGAALVLTRLDGLNWAFNGILPGSGYHAGDPYLHQYQHVQLAGENFTRMILGFQDLPWELCPYSDPFPGCGLGSIMILGGPNIAPVAPVALPLGSALVTDVRAATPVKIEVTTPVQVRTSSLTRADGASWAAAGFKVGMQVRISGFAGPFTISALSGSVMTFANTAWAPSMHLNAAGIAVWHAVGLTVTAWDEYRQSTGIRIGGDILTVCNRSPLLFRIDADLDGVVDDTVTCDQTHTAGPGSPLVIYGDTSQDGIWYSGNPGDNLGMEFGPKPFDPFTYIPDAENEDDEWIFGLANPYDFSGDDIIDASGLFAELAPANLPSVGITAYGGLGDDLIIGSQAGDHLAGGSGDDELRGQRGVDHIYGDSGVNVDVLTRALEIATINRSPRPGVTGAGFIPNGTTLTPTAGGVAGIVDDLLVAGYDLIHGEGAPGLGLGSFIVNAGAQPDSAYDDIVFGDHGAVDQDVADPNEPDARLQKIQTTALSTVIRIRSVNLDKGADDVIFGGLGRDVLIGGAGNDMADGDAADDILFGDAVWFDRADWLSGRFQTLCGTLLYSRSDITAAGNLCGTLHPVPTENASGELLVDGAPRPYRDPDGAPWWAEYDVTNLFHDVASDTGSKWAGTWGNDHLAGGQANDLLFGQLGDDVIQGDGDLDRARRRWIDDHAPAVRVGASRTPLGCIGTPGASLLCDYTGVLVVVPAVEAATDGEDYIEGGAGDDVIFGGLGQDDIIGGSSDFFSLVTADQRPDGLIAPALAYLPGHDRGADILFGGAGTRIGIDDQTTGAGGLASTPVTGGSLADGTTTANMDARDADTIVGDNGRIIRIVGVNGADVNGDANTGSPNVAPTTGPNYVTFAYDVYGATAAGGQRLVVRGVHLLDYTVGGPDYLPQNFGLGEGADCNGSPTQPTCSLVLDTATGTWRNTAFPGGAGAQTGGRDEVHGETGDDTVYGGADHDVIYGDAQNDDIIAGWGNDWVSGGTGSDGILGDDGRIFTSRNTGCSAASSTVCTELAEPLYGIRSLRRVDPDAKTSQGDVLNEYIYTPGKVQAATINIAGALVKSVDLTVYNLGPDTNQSQHHVANQPTYDANDSDDILFGGWGSDWMHGGSGDDAISGSEAIGVGGTSGYAQHFDDDGDPIGVEYIDFAHPWNPGDVLHFGADSNPWHANNHNELRLGEFYLYDEYDPRRAILFDGTGDVWQCTSTSPSGHTCTGSDDRALFPNQFFLNNEDLTGDHVTACIAVDNQGNCTLTITNQRSDGDDSIFGDLGNDWIVGGTGQDTLWGGWGNDLLNADDDLHSGCVTAQPNGTCAQTGDTWLNDTPDGVNSSFQDRAFGGAGLDILIGNTGGDRLIDWVGEFNTYLVPFSPFGIATVSRQVEPQLPEFLYALSRSQGVDLTRWSDEGTEQLRNGEPYGELGLITQHDHGQWQTQTGGPTDPQAGNIPGGRRDTLRGSDFNDGTMQGFATDSGVFAVQQGVLKVTAADVSGDAVAVWYSDAYKSIYYEVSAKISMDKPTAGWKANAYIVLDYFGPDDFKFAGIDQSTNKVVIGQRASWGWAVLAQASVPGGVKAGTYYDLNVIVNGLIVSVTINGRTVLSYTFPPRMLNGDQVALNKGLVGFGSDRARGWFDNIALTVIAPAITVDRTEYFDGTPQTVTTPQTGSWSTQDGRLEGRTDATGTAVALIGVPLSGGGAAPAFDAAAYVELEAVFQPIGVSGFVFDWYSASDHKFVALDVAGQRVLIGHVGRAGRTIDLVIGRTIPAGIDHTLNIVLKYRVVTVTLDGQVLASYAFNSPLGDGRQGMFGLGSGKVVSIDSYRLRTDEVVYVGAPPPLQSVTISDTAVVEGRRGTSRTVTLTVTRSSGEGTLSVGWSIDPTESTATAGVDYTGATSGVITFAEGQTAATITFTITGDAVAEGDESIAVRLQPSADINLRRSRGTVLVTDDDG
ncbi:hypothetical protein QF046_000326 [Microbacterium sp. W4I4]|uniref:Calx-beta domain-containing protein n=1 Tax=Microbacterium sp. W4I4 TaxID=3042295 RepID=UPI002782DA70|nr:Calx-beta domain-containing protein [Microbacterium sp. W4I4]MDQ0612685.1 hypothetical protein [Microbacterium sp. W4I4]